MTLRPPSEALDAVFAMTAAAAPLPDPNHVLEALTAKLSAWIPDAALPPIAADPSGWPAETLWLHPDPRTFHDRQAEIEEVLHARLAALPRGLRAGPPGCATVRNVGDFLADGQPDRAWRLAASLSLAARRAGLDGFAGQVADDLAASALLLAADSHGCLVGLVELLSLLGDLAERAASGATDYPHLALPGPKLAMHIARRRRAILERVASRVTLDEACAPERLMWRAPLARRPDDGFGGG